MVALCQHAYTASGQAVKLLYVGELPDTSSSDTETNNLHVTVGGKDITRSKQKGNEDTVTDFDIFKKFYWKVQITAANGSVSTIETGEPDTLEYGAFRKVEMQTDFTVAPYLLHMQHGLEYELNGAALIRLNGEKLLATGSFDSSGIPKYCGMRPEGFTSFAFKDTQEHLEVTYLPHAQMKKFHLKIKMGQYDWAQEGTEDIIKDNKEAFALGAYYFSFALVFLVLFIFFRERTENLYFALFCLFASLSWIIGVYETYTFTPFTTYMGVFSLEFLAMFFAKIIKNKEKSKIPLILLTIVAAASFHPSILYNFQWFGLEKYGNFKNTSVPVILIIIFVSFYCYVISTSIKYLVKGFRQKSAEAKTVVFICCTGLFVSFLLPPILHSLIHFADGDAYAHFKGLLRNIGLCIYPLSAAVVLGRRNSTNQKQLAVQVQSIAHLSSESLKKEQEKKLILESANAELERKVDDRTREILQQKAIIEIKNKAITDNLTYAQRIQSALLPDVKSITNAFSDSFILYLPKDIVSGDFYSFSEEDGNALVVTGDCTGHGVSGAFMSMIGSSLLQQIVAEKGIAQPDIILNHLNTAVIETLKQTKNDSNDGMDISLCYFNAAKTELVFAGANRPLWIIRDNQIMITRPDKFPIGGLQVSSGRTFTGHKVSLQKGDAVYMFTDGYADQFGGERGKKLMTAKFKETLLAIQDMTMQQQQVYLHDYFNIWKGSEEQVDDVLVMGIRI